jgi:hypothetical protein
MFEKMLKGPWKESSSANPSSAVGSHAASGCSYREISTTGWNANALLTVFKIIHGQYYDVPRTVSVEFIAQVAIIVNYYQCAEVVSSTAEHWYRSKYRASIKYGGKAIMWLFIAWVFS